MGEDSSHAERSSTSSNPTTPQQQPQPPQLEDKELLIPSFSPGSAPSSPTNTLTRLGLKSPTSPTSAAPGSPADRGQVSAITVVALLDKLVNMLEAVQDNQRRMEQRQADLEGVVRGVQGDVTRLSKTHTSTSNSVNKLLERSRKVSGHMKEVRERMDKQAAQVKRLEANHTHLLKRNHFKVLIFQEDNEIPTSVLVKDSLMTPQPSQMDAEASLPSASVMGSVDGIRPQEEGLQTISLSSDDDDDTTVHREEEEIPECEAFGSFASDRNCEKSRAERLKRSSLKKVDSLKKAFSRQSIEKKMSQISTKIVPPERREKIKKSLTPNHPKSPTAKSSSFKVSPMTFTVKKVRDGEDRVQDVVSPGEAAHVEIPPLGSFDGELPLAEVHSQEGFLEEGQEMLSPSTPESIKAELAVNGEAASVECDLNGDRPAELAVPEHDEEDVEDEDEEEEEEHHKSPVEMVAEAQIPTAAMETVS
ncbi:caveolae-associated protein 2a [Myripristis murdjan]|uniref:Caveolae associated protein 2a n=1 Tax=Myripristis murdjan TaxID=586833 RepID=A0A667YS12_9TELE|nr:caveolae-associated protein 2-like [Myripristis murdjan]